MAAENKDGAVAVERGLERTEDGVVVSDKMQKTVVVAVTRMVRHAKYGKTMRRTQKFLAHDEREECNVGDTVRIVSTRPLSRRKHWRVQRVIVAAQ